MPYRLVIRGDESLREEVRSLAAPAMEKSLSLLPTDRTVVINVRRDHGSGFYKGVSAFTRTPRMFDVDIDPDEDGWKEFFQATVVHEYNHIVRGYHGSVKEPMPLMESFAAEGLAECFAEAVFPEMETPWRSVVGRAEAEEAFDELRTRLDDTDSYFEVFHGDGDYPNWLGYTIGYYKVSETLTEMDEIDWSVVTRLPAEALVSA